MDCRWWPAKQGLRHRIGDSMSILSIVRDYGTNPSIVRMTTDDSYTTMTTAGYLTSQMPAFNQVNSGPFQFADTDMVLCYYPGGFQFFTLNATKTSLLAYTDTLPDFVASSVLATDQNSNPVWKGPLTNGQIIIGSTGAAPVASTLTAGSNVTITNSAGAVTISATGSGGGVNSGTINQIAYYAAAGATVSGVGPGNAGQLFQSNGAGSAPAFTTATYPSIATNTGTMLRANGTNYVASTATFADTYAASTLLYSNGANAVTGLATANNGVLVTSNAGIPSWLANGTAGQVLTANTGAPPSWQAAAAGEAWVDQTTASVTMVTKTGYTANAGASLISFTLPTTSAVGDFIEINGKGAGRWQILQAAGQQIFGSPQNTTLGAGGSLASVNRYDNVRLRCITANTTWTIVSQQSTGLTYL